MNLSNANAIAIGGKSVAKIEIGGRVVWRKSATQPDVPIEPEEPVDNPGTIYGAEGRKFKIYDEPILYYTFHNAHSNRQGCAVYGDYLFGAWNTNTTIEVWNIKNKEYVGGFTIGSSIKDWHSNSICFSSKKYDPNDEFPILYIPSYNWVKLSGDTEGRQYIFGYRITRKADGTFSFTRVQKIINEYGMYEVLRYKDYLYTPCSGAFRGTLKLTDDLPYGSDVTINAKIDASNPYITTKHISGYTSQGYCCENGYVFQTGGSNGATKSALYIGDVENKVYNAEKGMYENISVFEGTIKNMSPSSILQEPEAPFVWKNGIYVYYRDCVVKAGEFID